MYLKDVYRFKFMYNKKIIIISHNFLGNSTSHPISIIFNILCMSPYEQTINNFNVSYSIMKGTNKQ